MPSFSLMWTTDVLISLNFHISSKTLCCFQAGFNAHTHTPWCFIKCIDFHRKVSLEINGLISNGPCWQRVYEGLLTRDQPELVNDAYYSDVLRRFFAGDNRYLYKIKWKWHQHCTNYLQRDGIHNNSILTSIP